MIRGRGDDLLHVIGNKLLVVVPSAADLVLAREDNKVSYTSIWVRFKWLDDEMAKLRKEGRVKEKIELKQDQGDPEDNKPEETPEDTM